MSRRIKIRRIDFYPGDWLGGTIALSLAERGLYITACAMIYDAGGPIPRTDLRQAAGGRSDSFNRHLLKLIEKGKLELREGMISQIRCERELGRAAHRIAAKTTMRHGAGANPHVLSSSGLNETNDLTPPYARAEIYQPEGEVALTEQLSTDVEDPVPKQVRAAPLGRAGISLGRSPPYGERFSANLRVLGPGKAGVAFRMAKLYGDDQVELGLHAVKIARPRDPVRWFVWFCKGGQARPPPEAVPPPDTGPSRRLTPEEIDAIYARREAA